MRRPWDGVLREVTAVKRVDAAFVLYTLSCGHTTRVKLHGRGDPPVGRSFSHLCVICRDAGRYEG